MVILLPYGYETIEKGMKIPGNFPRTTKMMNDIFNSKEIRGRIMISRFKLEYHVNMRNFL